MCLFGFTNNKEDLKQNQYNEIYSINANEKYSKDVSNEEKYGFDTEKIEPKS